MNIPSEKLGEYKYNVPKDPETKIISDDSNVQVIEIKKKKKLFYGHENLDAKAGEEDDEPIIPREVVKTGDSDVVIQNFDVDYDEDEPELKLMGGIRGIRALKV